MNLPSTLDLPSPTQMPGVALGWSLWLNSVLLSLVVSHGPKLNHLPFQEARAQHVGPEWGALALPG